MWSEDAQDPMLRWREGGGASQGMSHLLEDQTTSVEQPRSLSRMPLRNFQDHLDGGAKIVLGKGRQRSGWGRVLRTEYRPP